MAGRTTAAVSDRFGKSAVKGWAKVKGEESGMCGGGVQVCGGGVRYVMGGVRYVREGFKCVVGGVRCVGVGSGVLGGSSVWGEGSGV